MVAGIELDAGTNTFPVVITFIGAFVLSFGLVSFLIKERLFLSDSLVATMLGIIFGPIALGIIDPFGWPGEMNTLVFYFSDLVINIQIMAATIALPRKFWHKRWRALAVLLGPVTLYMWLSCALIFWLVFGLPWLDAMILAACTAPTDPVLANSIVQGRFADLHVHVRLRQLLSGESAANDGAALPFFYLGVYLLRFAGGEAVSRWLYEVWLYKAGVAVVYGLVLGNVMRRALRYCSEHGMIDKNSFLVFEIALALVSTGVAHVLGFSSFIATFVTGLSFSYDGWFQRETQEAHVQEVLDMLVNLIFFLFFGAALPWSQFNTLALPLWKLIVVSILTLLLRRLPIVFLSSKFMSLVLSWQETFFVAWFGPIGVGALSYMSMAVKEFPEKYETFSPIVFFIVLSSVLLHGIMVPFVHITLVIKTRTMSKSAQVEVPMWPHGVPITVNMISAPTLTNSQNTFHITSLPLNSSPNPTSPLNSSSSLLNSTSPLNPSSSPLNFTSLNSPVNSSLNSNSPLVNSSSSPLLSSPSSVIQNISTETQSISAEPPNSSHETPNYFTVTSLNGHRQSTHNPRIDASFFTRFDRRGSSPFPRLNSS